jgi:membrane fusion protein (multidrug efflux system)
MAAGPGQSQSSRDAASDSGPADKPQDQASDKDQGKAPASTDDKGDGDNDDGEEKGSKAREFFKRPIVLIVGGVILLAVLIGALMFWLNARQWEATDDAFVDTHIVRVAPQVAGEVTQVLVTDNQLVKAGQPLVDIDSADQQTKVAQAQAQRAQAQAQVDQATAQVAVNQASYLQARADTASAAAQAENASRDLARYQALQRANALAVAQQQLDQATTQARQTAAQEQSAIKAADAKAEQVRLSQTQIKSGLDQVRAAEAELNEASINLGYAHLFAPVGGHIAQKTVAAGNYVQPGTELLAIVPTAIWITANFKETQLDHMRPGQFVKLHVDACPSARIEGHVDSIQRGAGQAFGILPPENATGNYVKVVQRVPVKIVFDQLPKDCPLGPGMSVEPSVKVR